MISVAVGSDDRRPSEFRLNTNSNKDLEYLQNPTSAQKRLVIAINKEGTNLLNNSCDKN
jgi:hypothetical protein